MSTHFYTHSKIGNKSSSTPVANQAVQKHFSSQRGFSTEARRYPIQTKLKIGQSGDKYEQEADRVAGQVMRMPKNTVVGGQVSGVRKDDKYIQTKPG